MKECLGGQFASPYFTIATLIVESVLPSTLTGISFFLSFGLKSKAGMTFWYVYTLMMVRRSSPVAWSYKVAVLTSLVCSVYRRRC